MTIIKTNPQKLLLAFALIMDKNNGRFDYRAVALAYEELKSYIFAKSLAVLSKKRFFQILDFFYEKSSDERIKKMPKDKFFRRYFKYLIKKGILKISNTSYPLTQNEIAIFIFNEDIVIVRELQAFYQIRDLL